MENVEKYNKQGFLYTMLFLLVFAFGICIFVVKSSIKTVKTNDMYQLSLQDSL